MKRFSFKRIDPQIDQVQTNHAIVETVSKLEHALPLLNTIIATKRLNEQDKAYLVGLHDNVRDVLARYKEVLEKTPFLFGENKRLLENSQFMMEAKKLR